ncbi:MAG: DedA family protein [Gammaproteobacteria bacterium]|nr:DedA family protein [Gammaproteobacteria bacterium]
MKLFSKMYERCLLLAGHRHAVYYLGGMSVAESIFFPIPVDVMLAPMAMAKREKAWFYATVCTACSVVGGILGYLLGMTLIELIQPLIDQFGYRDTFTSLQERMNSELGYVVVFTAGFSPIPYKLITITAGVIEMSLIIFLVASIIGRGARFYLVAAIVYWGGEAIDRKLKQTIDWLGWVVILLAVVGYLVYKYM